VLKNALPINRRDALRDRILCAMPDSPVDQLLERLRASLNLQRRDALSRVEQIRTATDHYLSAVEADIVRDFANTHGFGQDSKPKATASAAASTLLKLVSALPELAATPKAREEEASAASSRGPSADKSSVAASAAPATAPPLTAPELASPPRRALAALAKQRPLVVVGRLGKKDRLIALEAELPPEVEWLDTNQNGMAAIGNLERRLRERRVGALVLVEGSLGHKHTEPLVSAARQFSIPFAYANKGGKQSLLRAFDEIEASLQR